MDYLMQMIMQALGGQKFSKVDNPSAYKNFGQTTSRGDRGLPDFAQPRSQEDLDRSMLMSQMGPAGEMSQERTRAANYRSISSNGELDPGYSANFRTMIDKAGPQASLAYLLAQQRDFGGDPTAVSRQLGNNDSLQRDLADLLHPKFDWTVPSYWRGRTR